MNISRREEPRSLLSQILNEINKQGDSSNIATSQWIPPVDIIEDPDKFIIAADIPGVDPEKIEISMENSVLTIKGERSEEIKEDRGNFSRVERVKGVFYRRFSLPDTADEQKISARSNHGVLEIEIPKKEKAQPRKISISIDKQSKQKKLETEKSN